MSDERWYWTDKDDSPWSNGPFPTRGAAAADAERELPPGTVYRTGEAVTPDPLDEIDAYNFIEHICVQDAFSHDWADHWPGDSKDQRDDLTQRLRAAFKGWMDDHKLHPTFRNIVDIKEYITP